MSDTMLPEVPRDAVSDDAVTSEFTELVCADPAWLDAEFDAIVTANFGTVPPCPPSGRPRPGSAGPQRPGRPPRSTVPVGWFLDGARDRRPGGRGQRSPPRARVPDSR